MSDIESRPHSNEGGLFFGLQICCEPEKNGSGAQSDGCAVIHHGPDLFDLFIAHRNAARCPILRARRPASVSAIIGLTMDEDITARTCTK